MQNINSRVAKLEQVTGINEPCEVCESIKRTGERAAALMNRLGIVEQKRTPVPFETSCSWCLRPTTLNLCFFNLSERVLCERMNAAFHDGTMCSPGNEALYDEMEAAFERVLREKYGEHYDLYREEVTAVSIEELTEISTRRAPAKPYLCRVAGCFCTYPKTEEEARARIQKKMKAA